VNVWFSSQVNMYRSCDIMISMC